MNEPHAEPPPADVRSFLPRPSEPVEDYAARLRALHHDLTLVLDAVERGLEAAGIERSPGPVPVAAVPDEPHRVSPQPAAVATEPRRSPPPPGPLAAPRGSARVEVISTARGEQAGGAATWSGPPEPGGDAPWGVRRALDGEGAPAGGVPAAPSPERWPQEPWVERRAPAPRSAPWVEAEAEWPPPPAPPAELTFAPPAPSAAPLRHRAATIPPVVLAAAILGWLTVLALVLALALGL